MQVSVVYPLLRALGHASVGGIPSLLACRLTPGCGYTLVICMQSDAQMWAYPRYWHTKGRQDVGIRSPFARNSADSHQQPPFCHAQKPCQKQDNEAVTKARFRYFLNFFGPKAM